MAKNKDEILTKKIIDLCIKARKLTAKSGMDISLYASGNVGNVRFGDYSFCKFDDGSESLRYEPLGDLSDWKNVPLQEVKICEGGIKSNRKK